MKLRLLQSGVRELVEASRTDLGEVCHKEVCCCSLLLICSFGNPTRALKNLGGPPVARAFFIFVFWFSAIVLLNILAGGVSLASPLMVVATVTNT